MQRGLTTIANGASSATAALAEVNLSKSFVLMSYRGAGAINGVESQFMVRGALTNNTTLTFNRVSTSNNVDIAWEVISLGETGAAVERGTAATTATGNTTLNQTISAVDLSKAFAYISVQGGTGTNTGNLDELSWTAALTSPTNLRLQRGGSGTHSTINWQVVQFAGPPTNLAITAVNNGSNPTAGSGFLVVVQAQDANGNPASVVSPTGVTLTRANGTGTLGGTLTGTIAAGGNHVWIDGVTYDKAEGEVVLSAGRTSGDNLASGISTGFMVLPGAASTLAFTTQPGNATAGAAISGPPTVMVRDNFGNTVTSSTASVTLAIETNPGGGALSGQVSASAVAGVASFPGLSIDKAGNGYTLTASSSGLAGATSAGFNVAAGAASKLAFTVQPANTTAGLSLGGPPTVTVQDNFGNTVTSSTASIGVAIGTNPSSGVLAGTTNRSAVAGIAAFGDLTVAQAGTGYTLSATSTGLTAATSTAFNVIATGGTIAGVISRVSNGSAVNGALVQAFQGTTLMGSATTNATGQYAIGGLGTGTYTVRASVVGLVPQMLTNVAVIFGSTTTVNLSLNFGIAVQSPIAGATVNDFSVLVTGMFDTSLGEVGININGYIALQDGDEFAGLVPLDSQTSSLIATVTNTAGVVLGSHTIPIVVQSPATEPVLNFRPSPVIAFVTEPVSFSLTSLNPISQVQLDGNGDGTIDFTGATLAGVSVTFAAPGLYFPTVAVSEPGGPVRNATALVQVLDMVQLDAQLSSKWTAMKNALRTGNPAAATDYIVKNKRASYLNVFNNLTIPLANIDQVLTNIAYVGQRGLNIEYEMIRLEGGLSVSYMVAFVLDEDGVWRIKFF